MMTAFIAWCVAHPEIVAFVLTGLFTVIFKPRTPEQYAAMNPRVAAALKFIAAVCPDPIKAAKTFAQVITGKADPSKVVINAKDS